MNHQINEISKKFRLDIRLLDAYIEDIRKAIKELNNEVDKLKKYIEKGGSIEVKPKIEISEDGKKSITMRIADNPSSREMLSFVLNERIEQLQKYIELSLIMSFTYLIAIFDAKYIDIIQTYFTSISECFPPHVTVEKKVMKFAYKSLDGQISSIKENHKIDFEIILGKNVIDSLKEIRETRNIYLHNSGIVNRKYLDNVLNSPLIEGEYRIIDKPYLENAKHIIQNFFYELSYQISSKML